MKKMKKILAAACVLTMVLGLTACGGSSGGKGLTLEEGKLIMSTNAEFPPYEYYDGENIQNALIRAVTENRGLTSFLSLPAFRTEYMGKNLGLIDQFIAYSNPDIGWTIEKLCALTLIHDVVPRPRMSGGSTLESVTVDLDYIASLWRALDEFHAETAVWHPYWEPNAIAACETEDAYLSLYENDRVLGVLSNLTMQPKTVSIRTDRPRARNVLTGETFESHDGHITFTVEACKACLLEL